MPVSPASNTDPPHEPSAARDPAADGEAAPNAAGAADSSAATDAAEVNPDAGPDSGTGSNADASADASANEEASRATLGIIREPQRLHPLTLLQRILASLPALLLLLFPVLTSPGTENVFSLVLSIVYGLIALPAIVLQYLRFSYRVTPKQIVIQKGVFNRQNRSIPIERIQNIQIEQNLLAQIAGIAKVNVETAGSASTEGVLEYVGLDQAETIRRAVRSFQKQQRDSAASDDASAAGSAEATDGGAAAGASSSTAAPTDAPTDAGKGKATAEEAAAEDTAAEEAAAETLFTMSVGQVMLSGAFRFSLVYIGIILLPLQLIDPDRITRWVLASQSQWNGVAETVTMHPALSVLATVVLAIFLGWVTGVLLHINRFYGFDLQLDGDKLRKRHGLLTVTEGTIPLKKVQALIVKTNPLMRLFGWFELEVQTVGLNVDEQGHRVLVPFAQHDALLALAQRVRSFDMPEAFASVSPLTIRRMAVRYTLALSLVVALGAYFWPVAWWHPQGVAAPWWGLGLAPLLAGWAFLQYRHHTYAVQDDGLYIRRGVVAQYLWVIPVEKFHVFYTAASLFQRRLHLKTLFVDTAGAAAFAYPEVVDVPDEDADRCVSRLHGQFQTLYRSRVEAATGSTTTRLSADERPQLPDAAPVPGDE